MEEQKHYPREKITLGINFVAWSKAKIPTLNLINSAAFVEKPRLLSSNICTRLKSVQKCSWSDFALN
jgi:hypothetical protein